jgi:uncharacterized protein YggE
MVCGEFRVKNGKIKKCARSTITSFCSDSSTRNDSDFVPFFLLQTAALGAGLVQSQHLRPIQPLLAAAKKPAVTVAKRGDWAERRGKLIAMWVYYPCCFLCRPLLRLAMRIRWISQLEIAAASVALAGFCSTALCQVVPGQAEVGGPVIPTASYPRQIAATGKATIDATADLAKIRFAVECQNSDAPSAQIRLDESIRRAFQALETVGVDRDAIHASPVNLLPIVATPGSKDQLAATASFRFGKIIEVDLQGEQLAHIGSVVDAEMKAGVNRLEGIAFDVSPASRQRARLIAQATQDAQTKAQAIATTLGVPIGTLEDATESGITITPVASGVNGPLRMEASVTLHYRISPAVADANTITQ